MSKATVFQNNYDKKSKKLPEPLAITRADYNLPVPIITAWAAYIRRRQYYEKELQ